MPEVTLYMTSICPYCVRAKALLDRKGVTYHEIHVDHDFVKRKEMEQRSGRSSVPQIFIDDFHVGGYDDMAALDMDGGLDPRLGLGG
ncbi:MAG: glutaredoxin 3 [Gammaproteobacteria bacterium]|nr:glutaredoxin 3 [Gammaproteobacteria bacterium]